MRRPRFFYIKTSRHLLQFSINSPTLPVTFKSASQLNGRRAINLKNIPK